MNRTLISSKGEKDEKKGEREREKGMKKKTCELKGVKKEKFRVKVDRWKKDEKDRRNEIEITRAKGEKERKFLESRREVNNEISKLNFT